MDGARARTQFRKQDAQFIPAKINEIEKNENCHKTQDNATGGEGAGPRQVGSCGHRLTTLSKDFTRSFEEPGPELREDL